MTLSNDGKVGRENRATSLRAKREGEGDRSQHELQRQNRGGVRYSKPTQVPEGASALAEAAAATDAPARAAIAAPRAAAKPPVVTIHCERRLGLMLGWEMGVRLYGQR
jgi:hypothetical protein